MSSATAQTRAPAQPMMTPDTTREMQARGIQPVEPLEAGETKGALKTTEFYIYLAAVAGVLIASQLVDTTAGRGDYFRADQAWWFISLLTIGYLISRGLAKAGSRYRSAEETGRRSR
ncbi:MAG TPA: hypothetical protein VFX61_17575 [Micromonosporaceae bacterium]|nr:hypothetical protein [Micromonosporaceae bacterium]